MLVDTQQIVNQKTKEKGVTKVANSKSKLDEWDAKHKYLPDAPHRIVKYEDGERAWLATTVATDKRWSDITDDGMA